MSRLIYGGILCLGASKMNLARLQKLQNRALRICYCASRYTSNIKLHTDANVLPLYLRRKLDIYKSMYSRMLELERNPLDSDLRPTTRFSSSRPPNFTRPTCDRFLNSITYQAPKLWSELPPEIKNLNDSPTFNREIRKMLKNEMHNIIYL